MIYEAVCMKCGAYHTYVRKAVDYLNTPECCGVKTEKRILSAPMMRADIAPWDAYESPATGKHITSYAQRREDMKVSGCRDYEGRESEDRQASNNRKQEDITADKKLDNAVRSAWGGLSPEKKALALANIQENIIAFTEAQLNTQIDPVASGRVATLVTFNPGISNTDVYVVGVTAPYAGRSRWVQIPNTQTAAQAWTMIQAALAQ